MFGKSNSQCSYSAKCITSLSWRKLVCGCGHMRSWQRVLIVAWSNSSKIQWALMRFINDTIALWMSFSSESLGKATRSPKHWNELKMHSAKVWQPIHLLATSCKSKTDTTRTSWLTIMAILFTLTSDFCYQASPVKASSLRKLPLSWHRSLSMCLVVKLLKSLQSSVNTSRLDLWPYRNMLTR